MKKNNNIFWGVLLILVGVIFGLNALNITNINIFFDGWWTFIIIVPCFLGLLNEKEKTGNIIGIVIGLAFLLNAQNIITFKFLIKILFPILIIITGLSLIFKDRLHKKVKDKIIRENKNDLNEYYSTFATQNIKLKDKELENIELNAIFGGLKFDIRESIISDNKVVKIYSIFGSVKINVPSDVKVVVSSTPIFGSVTNKVKEVKNKDAKTIYVDAVSVFGGIEII